MKGSDPTPTFPPRLRILHMVGARHVPMDPTAEGASGMVRSTLELAARQAATGHDPWVVSTGRTRASGRWQGVHLERLRALPWAVVTLPGRGRLDFSQHLPLAALTWRHRFDVVHGQMYPYLRFLRAGARVAHFRTDPAEGDAAFATYAHTSDVQVAASHFIAGELARRLGPAGDVHTVCNGVDLAHYDRVARSDAGAALRARLSLDADAFVFLFAGAIVPAKGVLELARAFVALADAHPRVHLLLAGASHLWGAADGIDPHRAYEAEVQRLLAPYRGAGRVHALGKLDGERMAAAYAASDVVVVPSTNREGFGRVAVEALASRRPVLASRSGGLPEIVSDETGALLPPGDVEALRDGMERFVRDGEALRRRRERSRASVAHFDAERVRRQMDQVYAHALAKKRPVARRVRSA